MRPQAIIVTLLGVLALAGCGSGGDETWGGYDEAEAKEIMSSPEFRNSIVAFTPFDAKGRSYEDLLPTAAELEDEDLTKKTVQGQEAWEYLNEKEEFCLYVWRDPDSPNDFVAQPGACVAD
jgi:hypothetical protein